MKALSFLGFGKKSEKKSTGSLGTRKSLRMEPLEERQMLTVSPWANVSDALDAVANSNNTGAAYIQDFADNQGYSNAININLEDGDSFGAFLNQAIQQNVWGVNKQTGNTLVTVTGESSWGWEWGQLPEISGVLNSTMTIVWAGAGSDTFGMTSNNPGSNTILTVKDNVKAVTIVGFEIFDGKADQGGGIYIENSEVTLVGCNIHDNKADNGAGVYTDSKITIIDSVFSNNFAKYDGGALHITDASATITGSEFVGNKAGLSGSIGDGGAIFLLDFSSNDNTLNVADSKFTENEAYSGGGAIYVMGLDTNVNIYNSLIAGNVITGHDTGNHAGGGIDATTITGKVNLTNVTVADNEAGVGKGIVFGGTGTFEIFNSIIANNTLTFNAGTVVTSKYNLYTHSSTGSLSGVSDRTGDIYGANPAQIFESGSYHLMRDGLANGKGDVSLLPANYDKDLSGAWDRVRKDAADNDIVDMGAYTYHPAPAKLDLGQVTWNYGTAFEPYFVGETIEVRFDVSNVGESNVFLKDWVAVCVAYKADGTVYDTIEYAFNTTNWSDGWFTQAFVFDDAGDYYFGVQLKEDNVASGLEKPAGGVAWAFTVLEIPKLTLTANLQKPGLNDGFLEGTGMYDFTLKRDANDFGGVWGDGGIWVELVLRDQNGIVLTDWNAAGYEYDNVIDTVTGKYYVLFNDGVASKTFQLGYKQDFVKGGDFVGVSITAIVDSPLLNTALTKIQTKYEEKKLTFTVIDTTKDAELGFNIANPTLTWSPGAYNYNYYKDYVFSVGWTLTNNGQQTIPAGYTDGWSVELIFYEAGTTNVADVQYAYLGADAYLGLTQSNYRGPSYADSFTLGDKLAPGTYHIVAQLLDKSGAVKDTAEFSNGLHDITIVEDPSIWAVDTDKDPNKYTIVEGAGVKEIKLERSADPDGGYRDDFWVRVEKGSADYDFFTVGGKFQQNGSDGHWYAYFAAGSKTASIFVNKDQDYVDLADIKDKLIVNAALWSGYAGSTYQERFDGKSIEIKVKVEDTSAVLLNMPLVVTTESYTHVDGRLTLQEALDLAARRDLDKRTIYFGDCITTDVFYYANGFEIPNNVTIIGNWLVEVDANFNAKLDANDNLIGNAGDNVTVGNSSGGATVFVVGADSTVAIVGLNIASPYSATGIENKGDLSITKSTLSSTGGYAVKNYGNLDISLSTVKDSYVGVENLGAGDVLVTNSLVVGNGYGLVNRKAGTITAVNVTATNNSWGFWNENTTGATRFEQWSLKPDGTPDQLIKFWYEFDTNVKPGFQVYNSIVALNTTDLNTNGIFTVGNSLIGKLQSDTFINNLGGNLYNANPEFMDAAGGNYQLNPFFSPAFNTGSKGYYNCTEYGVKDLAGNPRITGGIIDMGCFESVGIVVTTLEDRTNPFAFHQGQGLSLREALAMVYLVSYDIPGSMPITFDSALFANGANTLNLTKGELGIIFNVEIVGPGADLLTINAAANHRIFNIGNANVLISDMTLANGFADNGGAIYTAGNLELSDVVLKNNVAQRGGAVYQLGGDFKASNTTSFTDNDAEIGGAFYQYGGTSFFDGANFADNTAAKDGGAMTLAYNAVSKINLTEFVSNKAGNFGGAVFMANAADAVFEDSQFSDNTALNGGGLYMGGTTGAAVVDSVFDSNTADRGAGIYQNSGTLKVNDTTFDANIANVHGGGFYQFGGTSAFDGAIFDGNIAGQNGAGIALANNALSKISNSEFTKNAATVSGGAIFMSNTANAEITNSEFELNTAVEGAGLYLANTAKATVTDSLLTNNSASASGGAIYMLSTSTLTLNGGELTSNDAQRGGAIYQFAGTVNVNGTVFTTNTASVTGGAFYQFAGNSAFAANASFIGNISNGDGGALTIANTSSAKFLDTTFTDNVAKGSIGGGAMYLCNTAQATFDVAPVLSGNTATQRSVADAVAKRGTSVLKAVDKVLSGLLDYNDEQFMDLFN